MTSVSTTRRSCSASTPPSPVAGWRTVRGAPSWSRRALRPPASPRPPATIVPPPSSLAPVGAAAATRFSATSSTNYWPTPTLRSWSCRWLRRSRLRRRPRECRPGAAGRRRLLDRIGSELRAQSADDALRCATRPRLGSVRRACAIAVERLAVEQHREDGKIFVVEPRGGGLIGVGRNAGGMRVSPRADRSDRGEERPARARPCPRRRRRLRAARRERQRGAGVGGVDDHAPAGPARLLMRRQCASPSPRARS